MAPTITNSDLLNTEHSDPKERMKQHLPPKSYADVAVENTNGFVNHFLADNLPQYDNIELSNGEEKDHQDNKNTSHLRGRKIPNGMHAWMANGANGSNGYAKSEPNHTGRLQRRKRSESELVSGRRAAAGWERSSIRFAPLNIPLKRRLQTLVVLCHTLTIVILLTIFFLIAAIPLTWPILVPYLIYVLASPAGYDGTLSHRSEFIRSLKIWSLFASYFPMRLHRSEPLPPTRKYIFGYHPHGILSLGAFCAFGTEALGFSQLFPGITNTLLTLDSNFRIPVYKDYALAMGLASVSRESCENILSKGGINGEGMGRAITIVVGGARESLDSVPGSMKLVLKRRLGFVKLAIRTGADLVPVIGFGENDLYEQISPDKHPIIRKGQLLMKKILGWTLPLFHARGVFNYDVGMMPYRRPVNIVIGRPIKIQQSAKPDPEYVEKIHKQYIEELERMWNESKDSFAPFRQTELEIIE
ncbi:MAG: diacylglycerol O-acyltransferase 1 [Cirrosporium novae-zelandiae]|nr:MAG: diacylglycerol O-acyltransferase 1 [Cirrosporium novae-zelandiae]